MRKNIRNKWIGIWLLTAFAVWTAADQLVDVQPIAPDGSSVGWAMLNSAFHRFTGVRMLLYTITDWLSLVPAGVAAGFALLGLKQWIIRKSLWKVDQSILVLGGFYLVVMAVYIFFEKWIVNVRPVLIDGIAEASYPSSTTILVICVMSTAMMHIHSRMQKCFLRNGALAVMAAFSFLMVIIRTVSGVHWLTDIIGGILFSGGVVFLYADIARFPVQESRLHKRAKKIERFF